MSGTAGLMMSQPTSSSSLIWRTVASTLRVSVLVMDCTVIGALPPTVTSPTWMALETRLVVMSTRLFSLLVAVA